LLSPPLLELPVPPCNPAVEVADVDEDDDVPVDDPGWVVGAAVDVTRTVAVVPFSVTIEVDGEGVGTGDCVTVLVGC